MTAARLRLAQTTHGRVIVRLNRGLEARGKDTKHLPNQPDVGEIGPDGVLRLWSPEERRCRLFDRLMGEG